MLDDCLVQIVTLWCPSLNQEVGRFGTDKGINVDKATITSYLLILGWVPYCHTTEFHNVSLLIYGCPTTEFNEWVREQVGVSEERSMLAEVRKRKIRKYGHWKRRGESMVLASIEEETDGKRKRGRQRMEWMENIITWEEGVEQAHGNARKRRSTVP